MYAKEKANDLVVMFEQETGSRAIAKKCAELASEEVIQVIERLIDPSVWVKGKWEDLKEIWIDVIKEIEKL